MSADDDVELDPLAAEAALWRLVSGLGHCATPFEVAEVLAQEGGAAAGGTFANMALLEEGSTLVRVVHGPGPGTALSPHWVSHELAEHVPACDAIRSGLPVLLGSLDQVRERYPAVADEIERAGLGARVSVPLRSADGQILGAIGFGWPAPQPFSATQLRRLDLIAQLAGLAVERSLEQTADPSSRRPTQVLESMPNALVCLDPEFTITYVNAEGERLLRSSRQVLIGRRLPEVFPEAGASQFSGQYLDMMASGGPVVFEEYFAPLDGWFEVHIWPDQEGLNVYFSDISERRSAEIERAVALDAATRANVRLSFLAQLNSVLSGVSNVDEIFARLSRAVVEHVADWCTVVVPSGDELVRVAAAHRSPALDELAKRLVGNYPHAFDGPSPGVVVYRSAEPLRLARLAQQIVDDLDDSVASAAYGRTLQMLGDGPGLIMPIISEGQVAAVLTMVRSAGEAFSDADVAWMTEATARISVSLEDAHKVETQRETARALQEAALPQSLPAPAGLVLAAGYRAASEGGQMGGDWYDALELPSGSVALVVGDAAGHGLRAAALMTQMRNVLRAHLFASLGPSESLSRLSSLIAIQEPHAFATIICLEIDPGDGQVTWASAGHPAPILLRGNGASLALRGRTGPPIGCAELVPHQGHAEECFLLEPADRLIMFTDGLVERRGVDIDIGLTHLMLTAEQTRHSPDTASACDMILERMLPSRHEDDVCLLIADFR